MTSNVRVGSSSSSSGFYFSVGDDTILFMFDIYNVCSKVSVANLSDEIRVPENSLGLIFLQTQL